MTESNSEETGFRKVKQIQFTVLNPKELLALSVCHIENESFENGKPKPCGLFDPRLGTRDKSKRCQTCNHDIKTCPGHFGHIELPRPMYHPGFLERVVEILKCVCHHCSRLRVNKSDPRFQKIQKIRNKDTRIKELIKLCKKKTRCEFPDDSVEGTGCGGYQPIYGQDDNLVITAELEFPVPEWNNKNKINLSPSQTLLILKRIAENDFDALGCHPQFVRPDWMIFTIFPVPPPSIRPRNTSNAAAIGEDDLTLKLTEIVRTCKNIKLKKAEGAADNEIDICCQMLQHHIATYIDSESVTQNSNGRNQKVIKCIRARLRGKEGRLRGNLLGKRVDFTGRTVITPDPDISVDEIGVPQHIAKILTFPEPVNDRNLEELKKRVEIGPTGTDGANFIILEGEKERIDLRYCADRKKVASFLRPGMKVERHLKNGDICLVNRQPSLHRFSIMAHRARIMPYSTFRLNLSVTTPYNADFDGDEMNIQVMQNYETIAEAIELMAVHRNITTPQSNKPVMGIVQDSLLGAKYLSDRDTFLTREEAMQRIGFTSTFSGKMPVPAILKPAQLWTGKQIISDILPNMNLDRFSIEYPTTEDDDPEESWISPTDTRVIIRNGELLAGNLCKRTLGNVQGSLIHVIYNDFGPMVNLNFMNDIQRISSDHIVEYGVSVGLKDMRVPEGIDQKVTEMLKVVEDEINNLQKNNSSAKEIETLANKLLNSVRKKAAEDTLKSLPKSNVLKQQIGAGSKGSSVNPAQMIRLVGQQNIDGQRIPLGFQGRTLPHFKKGDNGPRARGFVKGRYVDGLAPDEFFFHSQAGREGISDTSIKTSDIGYVHRKLEKAMEDLSVKHDRTVRNSQGEIVQFICGEDGMDASTLETQTIESISISKQNFCSKFEWQKEIRLSDPTKWLTKEWNRLKKDYEWGAKYNRSKSQALPVNIRRMIEQLPRSKTPFTVSDAPAIAKKINSLQKSLANIFNEQTKVIENPFFVMLRSFLASKRIVQEWKLDFVSIEILFKKIKARFIQSLSTPGDMVGTTAAQSIGEPATQMTLRTFHATGQSEKNVTLGVPRLKEIVNAAKKTKTPSLTIYLKESVNKNKIFVEQFAKKLEFIFLNDVILCSSCWYDPDGIAIPQDVDLVTQFKTLSDSIEDEDSGIWSQYVLRFTINGKFLQQRNIQLQEVVNSIKYVYGNTLKMEWNDEYCKECVIRIRVRTNDSAIASEDYYLICELESMIRNEIGISGVKGIQKTYVRQDSNGEYIIETNGINLIAVLGLPEVDQSRTYTNDIHEAVRVLGIEGARKTILRELVSVLSFDDNYVNIRHPSQLADVMTHGGYIMGMNRHGINRKESGPLLMASFEETPEVLHNAARFYKTDNIKGVTETIILGMRPPIGTGTFDLMFDMKALTKMQTYSKSETPKVKRFNYVSDLTDMDTDPYNFMPSSPTRENEWRPPSPPPIFDYSTHSTEKSYEPS